MVYFRQHGHSPVSIYNYGHKRKTGVLIGSIDNGVFEFEWRWFELGFSGYGRRKLANDGRLLLGVWWYENKENLIEHVGYRYVSDEMPNWIFESDFDEFAKPLGLVSDGNERTSG